MKKTVSLNRNYEFMRLYKKGRFFVGKYIILYTMNNNSNINRLGITVNKKVGKSVRRNRFKRLIKESYRFHEDNVKNGCDFVFVARSGDELPAFLEVRREMKFLLKKLDVYIKDNGII